MRVDVRETFHHWIVERELLRLRRLDGEPYPWTKDEILRTYRFCNVSREHDRVTMWIDEHIRQPMADWPGLVQILAAARHVNLPNALGELIDKGAFKPSGVNTELCIGILQKRRAAGLRNWNRAYMITNQVSGGDNTLPKEEVVFRHVIPQFRTFPVKDLPVSREAWCKELVKLNGIGWFLAGQIACDAAYTPLLRSAPDHNTWASIGPGARRGMNRWLGRPIHSSIREEEFLRVGAEQYEELAPLVPHLDLTAHDVYSNVNCEVDKYLRAVDGGRPKNKYLAK